MPRKPRPPRPPVVTPPPDPVPPPVTIGGGLPDKPVGVYYNHYGSNIPRVNSYSAAINVIFLFHCIPQGSGGAVSLVWPSSYTSSYSNAQFIADVQSARSSGKKVLITVGGANANVPINGAANADACVASIQSIANQLGGIDGVDMNNFEAGGTSTPAGMAYLGKRLKTAFGQGFIVSSPVAIYGRATGGRAWNDRIIVATMHAEGAIDWVGPQYYDGTGNALSSTVATVSDFFAGQVSVTKLDGTQITTSVPKDKIGIGFGMWSTTGGPNNQADSYWLNNGTAAAAAYNASKSAGRTPRGAYCWSSSNPTGVAGFIASVAPAVSA